MTTATSASPNTPGNCRWSRVGYRLSRVPEQEQPETLLVCVRPTPADDRRSVNDEDCADCTHWAGDVHVS